jgi:hypothetical protein
MAEAGGWPEADPLLEERQFYDALERARASGQPEVRVLESSPDLQVELQTFPNGFGLQVETYRFTPEARDAVSMSRLARAVGAPVGLAFVDSGSSGKVLMREYRPEPEPDSPEGQKYGLYQVLIGRDGPHARYLRDAATGEFQDHELALSEVFGIRQRVAQLLGVFTAPGHGTWTVQQNLGDWPMLRDLAEVERHARHTRAERRGRDGLTREAREKLDLLKEMDEQGNYPKLVGFDHPYVPCDAVRQVKRFLDSVKTKPWATRARIGGVTVDFLPGDRHGHDSSIGATRRGTAEGRLITVDLGRVADPDRMQSAKSRSLQTGFRHCDILSPCVGVVVPKQGPG